MSIRQSYPPNYEWVKKKISLSRWFWLASSAIFSPFIGFLLLAAFFGDKDILFESAAYLFSAFSVISFIVIFGIANVVAFYYYNHYYRSIDYDFLPDGFYFKSGVWAVMEQVIPYDKIQDVDLFQDLDDKICGNVWRLGIRSASRNNPVQIIALGRSSAESLRDLILRKTKSGV